MLTGLIASLIVVSLCVTIHIVALVLLISWLMRHPLNVERRYNLRQYVAVLTRLFAVITLLHLGETLIWAAFYDLWGQFKDFETSWYFSLACYATIGYGDVVLPPRWRLIGCVEGINGVLLCGLSTAFLFAVFNQMFAIRHRSTSGKDVTGDAGKPG